jgi:hypothetical protein
VAAPHTHIQRASRELIAVARRTEGAHADLRLRLLAILWVTVVIDVIATLIVYFAERHASGTQIHDLFDAFIFSTSQLVTASSVAVPATDPGKLLTLLFEVYAIFVVATLAGSFGAFFHHRSEQRRKEEAARRASRSAPAG